MAVSLSGARAKGDRAERELVGLLRDQLGDQVVRARVDSTGDHGDLAGLAHLTAQVKDYDDVLRAIREGLDGAAEQKARTGTAWAAAFIRRRGGRWMVAMTLDEWISLYRDAVLGVRTPN